MVIPDKTSLGINGEHKALGNEFGMAEFKGFMVSEMANAKEVLKEIKEENGKQWEIIGKNKTRLDVMKGQAMIGAIIISAVISIGVIVVSWSLTNLDKIAKAFGGG